MKRIFEKDKRGQYIKVQRILAGKSTHSANISEQVRGALQVLWCVLEDRHNSHESLWLISCEDCGRTYEVSAYAWNNEEVACACAALVSNFYDTAGPKERLEDVPENSAEALVTNFDANAWQMLKPTLEPRLAFVIEKRFGIGCDKEHTLAEIGESLGLTRERVRQLESEAMRRLRHPSRKKLIHPYFQGHKA